MVVMDKSLYYSPNQLLSYDRILNMVVGSRGTGKSYGWKVHPIKRFLKYGEQMIYVRRYKSELKKIKKYFDDVKHEFPGHEFKVNGWNLMIDGKQFGWAVPLSAYQNEKSTSYEQVTHIVFDEFLRDGNRGYLKGEVDSLLSFMDTVFRNRENCRCVCLANSTAKANPYFLYFGIDPDLTKRFNAYQNVVVELVEAKEFIEKRKQTRFGQLIQGTDYADMSLENKFVDDTKDFIAKRPPHSQFVFSLEYEGRRMGVWVDRELLQLYISNDHDPSTKRVYCAKKEDYREGIKLVRSWKDSYYTNKLVRCYMNGDLRYENQVLRTVGMEMLNKLRV